MRASPSREIGTCWVVSAAAVFESAPQYSEALIVVTGPGVPFPGATGITRPRTRRFSWPPLFTRPSPRFSTHGAPPGATPWNVGSLGCEGEERGPAEPARAGPRDPGGAR